MSDILNKYLTDNNITLINAPTKKMVDEYDNDPNSEYIFNLFKKQPYIRIFFQMIKEILKEKMLDRDTMYNELNLDLKNILSIPLSKDILCHSCGHLIKSYNPYIQKKPRGITKCPKCKRDIDLKKCQSNDDWNIPSLLFNNILQQFYELNILEKHFTGFCESCSTGYLIEEPTLVDINKLSKTQLKQRVNNLYCPKCKQVISTKIMYSISKDFSNEFWKSGIWLEWYVKKLLESKKIYVRQGIVFKKNDHAINIDVLFVKNNKIYGIECKAFNPKKIAEQSDVVEVTNYIEYLNKAYLVITGNIKKNDEDHLKRKRVLTIDGRNIEKIDKYI